MHDGPCNTLFMRCLEYFADSDDDRTCVGIFKLHRG